MTSENINAAIEALHSATAIYTAEPLVDQLLSRLNWVLDGKRLVDPSCGDGMFLTRALAHFLQKHPRDFDSVPLALQGWEIHAGACQDARDRITLQLLAAGCSGEKASSLAYKVVRHGDFLADGPSTPTWDIIAGNPPYLRWLNVPELLRERYKAHVPDYASADLLHSFLDRCVQCLRPGGRIGLIVADRVLTNSNASRLREQMGNQVAVAHVERVDVRTAFYRPKNRRSGTPPRIHPVLLVLVDKQSKDAKHSLSSAPIYPQDTSDVSCSHTTLGDYAAVRIAPWLGTKGIFQISEQISRSLPKELLVPVVDSRDVARGLFTGSVWKAIRTDPDTPPPKAVLDHLQREMPRMSRRGRRKIAWAPPESWHNWDLTLPSLLIPRVAKDLSPVRIPSGVLPINHSISIPFETESQRDRLEACLTSPSAKDWLTSRAPRLENGYFSISVKLLRTMPLFES